MSAPNNNGRRIFSRYFFGTLFSFLFLISIQPASASGRDGLQLGPALWGMNESFIAAWETRFGYTAEFDKGQAEFLLYVPILLRESYLPYLPALPPKKESKEYHWVTQTQKTGYELVYLEKLRLQYREAALLFSSGVPGENSGLTYWDNPFYGPDSAFLSRYVSILYPGGEIIGSDVLTKSSLVLGKIQLQPFSKKQIYIFRDMNITPVLWGDNAAEPGFQNYGAALEVLSGGFQGDMMLSGAILSAHVFHSQFLSEEYSTRALAGIWTSLPRVGVRTGYVNKSEAHPAGHYLSPLYPIRKEEVIDGNENVWLEKGRRHGILAGVSPGFASPSGLTVEAELYPELTPVATVRLKYHWKKEDDIFSFVYLRENIVELADFSTYRNQDCYTGIYADIALIPGYLLVHGNVLTAWRSGASNLALRMSVSMLL